MDRGLPRVALAIVVLMATAAGAYSLYITVLAFVGGTVWPFGWEFAGSLGAGLLWLVLGFPLISTVAWWATMLILMPMVAIFGRDE